MPPAAIPPQPPAAADPLVLVIARRRVLRLLVGAIAAVLLAHAVRSALVLSWPPPREFAQTELLRILDMGGEAAIGTWLTIGMMLGVVVVAGVIALAERRAGSAQWRGWVGVAIVFGYASIDEQLQLHEALVLPMRGLLGITSGPLWLAWVVPALVLVAVLALVFAPFAARLPRRTRTGVVVAIGLWLAGAIGVEMLDAATFPWREAMEPVRSHLVSAGLVALEETMEMLGVALLLHVLLGHVRDHAPASAGARLVVR
ncbi:hypothetical protein [Microcella humidisoli]|uniref:Multidrug transporter n=1 Tax=Microcella humidisoli TaxID=2963406 RepID=A0ABY5FY54_9MICO|nr:hypothetical protein [Microcella humidisoli]UTT63049.1 hypothetical protein NNL39_02760 [Microcella humidisoli]